MQLKYLNYILLVLLIAGCSDDNTSSSSGDTNNTVSGFNIEGSMNVSNNTATDSDVNDTNASYKSNDSVGMAQRIPNPVILGGYVNQPNSGPDEGRSFSMGDVDDYFQVDLKKGNTITVFVANANEIGNDVDLALLGQDGKSVNASLGEGDTEYLVVEQDGRYFIQVQAYRGHSSYVLSIGQPVMPQIASMQIKDKFVVGEVIVKFNDKYNLNMQSTLQSLGLTPRKQNAMPQLRQIYKLDFASSKLSAKSTANTDPTTCSNGLSFKTEEQTLKCETLLTVKELRQQPNVNEASPNYLLKSFRVPNDALYRYQWNLPLIHLPQAWDMTTGNNNPVIVAVIDTGVLLNHPDLKGQLVGGYDFIDDPNIALDGDGIDSNPDDPGDQSRGGSSFHGTHVAGTIAALTNNQKGISGVSWNAKIMPLRVLGRGGVGSDFDTEQAVRYAAGLPNLSGTTPERRADVMNLSLGGERISSGLRQALIEARQAGVIIVAAAGNDAVSTPNYPAALSEVVSVSAVNINRELASYSNYGNTINVTAPGGDKTPDVNGDGVPDGIISTVGDDSSSRTIGFEFASSMGTSMSSPHVAGVVALMKAVNPGLSPQAFESLLENGKITDDLGVRGRDDDYGYGLINAQKSVSAALETGGDQNNEPAPQLMVSPRSLNFGLATENYRLSVTNGGAGNLQVIEVRENSGGYLSVFPNAVDENGLGEYMVTVSRNNLPSGTYTATVTVITTTEQTVIPIILQVGDSSEKGNAGNHYILLINPETMQAEFETTAIPRDGVYYFRFTGVRAGNYLLYAGSDMDNDNRICDLGEACAAYLTPSDPSSVNINGAKELTRFSTGFNVYFRAVSLGENTQVAALPANGFKRLYSKRALAQ